MKPIQNQPTERNHAAARGGRPIVAPRRGFTLVELLITITIIGIMASLMLFAMVSAQETARADKTRALIAKIHPLLMHRYESYRTRRMPVNVAEDPSGTTLRRAAFAKMRVDMLRETMRMELPDRWTDVIDDPVFQSQGLARPAISQAYLRRYKSLVAANGGTEPTNLGVFQGAECLYMIVTVGLPDESGGRELFHGGDIGDLDKDGAPEILDGWGNPIRFLRWAPGFTSDDPSGNGFTNKKAPGFVNELQSGHDPDPLDPRHVYGSPGDPDPKKRTFALYPLIYSAGSDQSFDIASDFKDGPNAPLRYKDTVPPNNPYIGVNDPAFPDGPVGSPEDLGEFKNGVLEPANGVENWKDNIHNHLIGSK